MDETATLRRIRVLLAVFVVGLILSGVTAFPLGIEARAAQRLLDGPGWPVARHLTFLTSWIDRVSTGLTATYARYPFIAYGTDWLAFGHLTIAVAFWGPYREPVRNIWVLKFGLIACAGVVPLALLSFGESWHNSHHADPSGARHGVLPGQLDPSARVIWLFERLRWAHDVHWPRTDRLSAKLLPEAD